MANTTDTLLGANLNVTSTTQQFALGQRTTGTNGTVWVYGKAAMVITKFDFVTMDSSFNISSLMSVDVGLGKQIGTAQVAFALADFGWICITGTSISGNCAGLAQPSSPIVPSATTGSIMTTGNSSGLNPILGIDLLATGSAGAVGMTLTSPVLKL